MHSPKKPLSCGIDLNAPGGLEALFEFHRTNFPADATMEHKPGESGGDTKEGEADKSKEGSQNDPPGGNDDDDDKDLPEGLGDAGKAAIKRERQARKEADRQLAKEKRDREAAEKALREREDKDLTEAEKNKRDAEELRKDNEKLTLINLRLQALANHSVPKDYQYLVNGTDEESFEKSAKDVAALAAGKPKPDVIHEQGSGSGSGGGNKTGGSISAGQQRYRDKHPQKTNS